MVHVQPGDNVPAANNVAAADDAAAENPPTNLQRLLTFAKQLITGVDDAHPDDHTPPDFEKSVAAVLAIFTVFTGYTINNFMTDFNLKSVPIKDLSGWKFWAFFAFVSLMLRYIFGSAIHLNVTYVGRTIYVRDAAALNALNAGDGLNLDDQTRFPKKITPKSRSVVFLFKDFLFLAYQKRPPGSAGVAVEV